MQELIFKIMSKNIPDFLKLLSKFDSVLELSFWLLLLAVLETTKGLLRTTQCLRRTAPLSIASGRSLCNAV